MNVLLQLAREWSSDSYMTFVADSASGLEKRSL
jgi:hypothetical protein